MATGALIPAWILFLIGLYAIAAAVGEFRRPGSWLQMLEEIAYSSTLAFIVGLITLTLGAAIYLVNPYNPNDWRSILVTVLGGFIMLEGLFWLAIPDILAVKAGRLLRGASHSWAVASLVIGILLAAVGFYRLGVLTA